MNSGCRATFFDKKRNTDLMNKGLKPIEKKNSVNFFHFKRNTDLMNKGLKLYNENCDMCK